MKTRSILIGLLMGILLSVMPSATALSPENHLSAYLEKLGDREVAPQFSLLPDPEMVMLPMRDGVSLSTAIYKLPIMLSPKPAIVVRTPYDKAGLDLTPLLLALQNYVFVIQDTRGRHASEGDDRVFQDDGWGERQDGYDTIEWVARQSWCNGKVGTWGPSALGIAQGLAAGSVPPSLVTQVITFAPSLGFGQTAYQGGVFRKALIEGWLTRNNSTHMIPLFKEHTTNSAFWAAYDIASRHSKTTASGLFIGGWYDCFLQGTIDNFNGRQLNGAEGAKGNQRLILGPWTHVGELDAQQGELSYPQAVYIQELPLTLDWFNYWLRDTQNGVMDAPSVTYYVMGDSGNPNSAGNVWKTSEVWPPHNDTAPLYLHNDGRLWVDEPSATPETLALHFTANDPVPTLGGQNLEIAAGPMNQASLETRDDVLVFTSPPLEEAVEVTGRVMATIYAASELPDNDITVRLCDVYPDGRSMLVTDGIVRASFRESDTQPTPIVPGQVYAYSIDLWSTSIAFDAGHRIRILVANSNYPRFDLNPEYQTLAAGVSATTTIYMSAQYPSHILLPTQSLQAVGIGDWSLFN
jgi:uncharacterized protein